MRLSEEGRRAAVPLALVAALVVVNVVLFLVSPPAACSRRTDDAATPVAAEEAGTDETKDSSEGKDTPSTSSAGKDASTSATEGGQATRVEPDADTGDGQDGAGRERSQEAQDVLDAIGASDYLADLTDEELVGLEASATHWLARQGFSPEAPIEVVDEPMYIDLHGPSSAMVVHLHVVDTVTWFSCQVEGGIWNAFRDDPPEGRESLASPASAVSVMSDEELDAVLPDGCAEALRDALGKWQDAFEGQCDWTAATVDLTIVETTLTGVTFRVAVPVAIEGGTEDVTFVATYDPVSGILELREQ